MSKAPLGARLGAATLPRLAGRSIDGAPIEWPHYPRRFDRRICHLGIGRFHRAHQARVLHTLLQQGDAEGWGLCAIGLRGQDRPTLDALRAQDGLYSLTETDGASRRIRVIGSIMQCIDASSDASEAIATIADATTRIVSLTITEAGYCLDANGRLDLRHADIAHDLADAASPRSAPGLLVRALELRRRIGGHGLTLMSCDNLIDNGKRLRTALVDLARARDPALAQWIDAHCRFPCSMVDRITPGADPERERALCEELGVHDAAPVLCENWLQWVVEDDFADGRPAFERAGVVLCDDVPAHERLKVGLLNGGHSAIAHIGLLRGHRGVHEAMADPLIAGWLATYLHCVAETLDAPPGIDVDDYCASLTRRFGNAALDDTLLRLAEDSSAKFRQTLLPPLRQRIARGMSVDVLARAVALWLHYLARLPADGGDYRDVAAAALVPLARAAEGSSESWAFVRTALALTEHEAAVVCAAVDGHLHVLTQSGVAALATP
ncbi:mannitol dehydrogenase family protein [Sinimarinibacterium thermocellulolyticum]|uniref:Mannitol dehydrogenase family protein n=1 Tax=Sinimarinibacterium thermocellulolyticum TaxID=3170016 RepID=A0ABV2ADD4_9GAMM